MASATGIPARAVEEVSEDEPLLGRPGDVSQTPSQPLYYNLFSGTAVLAQAGLALLIPLVWSSIFLNDLILFSAHPLLNSAGILFVVESILVLQPTHTAQQKRSGTIFHAIANNFALDLLVAGLIVIEYNKISHNATHFVSVHGILGFITYILLFIQVLVGFTQYFVPQLYGGVDKAKAIYKWHRISGYVVLTLMIATVAAATQTDYNKNVLDIKLWAVLLAGILLLAGVYARIKKGKLGIQPKQPIALE